METLNGHDDLLEQEWITTFVTARELLRRDAAPVEPASVSPADEPGMTIPYDTWGWLD